MNMFPVTDDGEFPLGNHKSWVAQQRRLEDPDDEPRGGANEDEGAIVPGTHDIILGRHWEAKLHEGNTHFLNAVAKHWETHDASMKHQKKQIAEAVVQEVKAAGGRFLKCDGAEYVLVDDKVAREKTSNAFRDRRKMIVADEKRKVDEIQSETDVGSSLVEVKRTKGSLL